jgi:hypothetical protein
MATHGDGFRVDRTQEVGGSSPPSSISRRPAQAGFSFSVVTVGTAVLAPWSRFGRNGGDDGAGLLPLEPEYRQRRRSLLAAASLRGDAA